MTKLAVSVPEAAEMVGIGRSSLYTLFRDGKLTPRKSGKRTLVLVDELKRYVNALPAAHVR
jgi:excisionase family DNA binding protein